MNTNVGFIILGSGLALVASLLVEVLKVVRENYAKRKNTKISLKLEFKNGLNLIDKLTDGYTAKHYFEIKTLDQFANCLSRLEAMKNNVIYLKEDIKKEEILTYINTLSIFVSDIRAIEAWAFDKINNPIRDLANNIVLDPMTSEPTPNWNNDYYKSERQMLTIKSVDLKRRGQDIVTYLDR